ncbi:MAG: AmmeMemoRadiSam system protein B [Candidatus Marinimicrobia bacterium]|nr:AmmeMemoRadiSam system protein B [Candidatus Neomarinimicrobiota bacterium]
MIRSDLRRPAARAFYPGDCRRELVAFTSGFEPSAELTGPLAGAILPHGGWMYSGRVAARTLASLAAHSQPVTVVIFGSVHVPLGANALYPAGRWETPLGDLEVDAEAGQAILRRAGDYLRPDSEGHRYEHSLEVLTPMVKYFFPAAAIVPIMVLPDNNALGLGRAAGEALGELDRPVVLLASSDLTHYGAEYGLLSAGTGDPAERWMQANDRRMIEILCSGSGTEVLAEASRHMNACGPGALAALKEALRVMDRQHGQLVEYATSHDIEPDALFQRAVGYAGIVFGPGD